MDVGALSISMSQNSLGDQVGIALLKKSMDNAVENTQSLIKTMEPSVNPNLGRFLDIKV